MFANFPKLALSKPAMAISVDSEITSADGCVKKGRLDPVSSVRISYLALCHVGHLARDTTNRRSTYGRLFGLQLGSVVEIADVCPNVLRMSRKEIDETEEQAKKRLEEERRAALRAIEGFQKVQKSEELDDYQVGQFVIASANYSPYSTHAMKELMALYDSAQPTVLLTYDPFRTSLFGRPYVRAFVPTEEYCAYHEMTVTRPKDMKLSTALRQCNVTSAGMLREVEVTVDVDAYHALGLMEMNVDPIQDNFCAIQSDIINDYVEALVKSVSINTDMLRSSLETENRINLRESNGAMPLCQRTDTLLALQHLREQTQHLESVCDSILINSSLIRDL